MRQKKKAAERVPGNGGVPTEPRRIAQLGHLKEVAERGEEKRPYEKMERAELAKRLAGKKVLFVNLGGVDVLSKYLGHMRECKFSTEMKVVHANEGQEWVIETIHEGWDVVIFNLERSLEKDARRVAGYANETGAKLIVATASEPGGAKTAFGRKVQISGVYPIGSARHDFADFDRVLLGALLAKEGGQG